MLIYLLTLEVNSANWKRSKRDHWSTCRKSITEIICNKTCLFQHLCNPLPCVFRLWISMILWWKKKHGGLVSTPDQDKEDPLWKVHVFIAVEKDWFCSISCNTFSFVKRFWCLLFNALWTLNTWQKVEMKEILVCDSCLTFCSLNKKINKTVLDKFLLI